MSQKYTVHIYNWSLTNNSSLKYVYKGGSFSYDWITNPIANYVDNQWHMLTVTFDGTLGMIYLDGTLFVTKASSSLNWGSMVNVTYFGVNNNEKFYNGKLDNFRSYNRALTPSEIQALFNAKQ